MHDENAGQIIYIECNKIISESDKRTHSDIVPLSENIKKYGIIQPIHVRPVKYGLYEIVNGKRRFAAAKLSGLSSVPCIIMNIDHKTSVAYNYIENSFRKNIDYFEEAEIIKNLIIDQQYTIEEISYLLCTDIFDVINKLKILHFSAENKIKIKQVKLSFNQCIMLLKLENTEFFEKAIEAVTTNFLNENQTKELVNKLLSDKRNTIIFKDIRIFSNTILHAVQKMNSAGIKTDYSETETDENIKYSIIVSKHNKCGMKSHNV
ncbi:MAG: ParB/RepB/Spo0J family partition protein [Ruminococcaceae bacterium]|nr:ParB/RepB/Spo0J family partition protein [Oscillospiraceae bacterium]